MTIPAVISVYIGTSSTKGVLVSTDGQMRATAVREGGAVGIGGGVRYFDAYPVQAVDTTGAGDAFNAALAAALVRGEPMEVAIDYGCRAGAFCVTRSGVIDGLGRAGDLIMLG
jgi:sugar/nucleoside kinase (ribokinase family)